MHTVILACESLMDYVCAAQKKLNTAHMVSVLNYKEEEGPEEMRDRIRKATGELPEEIDTVLVAMGFCGGSWDRMTVERRTVIPKVDDCVSMLLNTDHRYRPNPKELGHLYLTERYPDRLTSPHACKRICRKCPRWKEDDGYARWFAYDSFLDVVDTGIFNCYSEQYAEDAQRFADTVHCTLDYIPGSNLLLEKLIGGQWDAQFLVAEAGQTIMHHDFFGKETC